LLCFAAGLVFFSPKNALAKSSEEAKSSPVSFGPFKWKAGKALLKPISDKKRSPFSVKDPSVVRYKGQWYVFATTADKIGGWNMEYRKFSSWSNASSAKPKYLDVNPVLRGYHCAPQVF